MVFFMLGSVMHYLFLGILLLFVHGQISSASAITPTIKQDTNETNITVKKTSLKEQFGGDYLVAHIDLSRQRMKIYEGDRLLYRWKISTARPGYVTPTGSYKPGNMERMHYSKLYHHSPMPHSVFFRGNFAIHGTNYIRGLGHTASHGCVRLHPKNAKRLFSLIRKHGKKNTLIYIER